MEKSCDPKLCDAMGEVLKKQEETGITPTWVILSYYLGYTKRFTNNKIRNGSSSQYLILLYIFGTYQLPYVNKKKETLKIIGM